MNKFLVPLLLSVSIICTAQDLRRTNAPKKYAYFASPHYDDLNSFITIGDYILNYTQAKKLATLKESGNLTIGNVRFKYLKSKIKIAGKNYRITEYYYKNLKEEIDFVEEIKGFFPNTNGFKVRNYYPKMKKEHNILREGYFVLFKDQSCLIKLSYKTIYLNSKNRAIFAQSLKTVYEKPESIKLTLKPFVIPFEDDIYYDLVMTTSLWVRDRYADFTIELTTPKGKEVDRLIISDPMEIYYFLEPKKK